MSQIVDGESLRLAGARSGTGIEPVPERAQRDEGPGSGGPRTVLPVLPPLEEEPDPVRTGVSRSDVLDLLCAAGAGLGIGVLLSVGLGAIPVGWMFITAYLAFVGLYTVLVWVGNPGQAVRDRFWTVVLWSAAVVVVGSLVLVIGFVAIRGWTVFAEMLFASGQDLWQRLHFFWQDMSLAGPTAGLDTGGILHAIVATLIQIGIALAITIPLGLLTAIFLAEIGGRFARVVRTVVEAMTALPSVVAGLFIYSLLIIQFHWSPNGFAASLSITILMLPIMIRAADVVLRLVPGNLREGAYALGSNQWQVIWHVVLPTVRSGLTTSIILAAAHGLGETAPVLLTSGVTGNFNANPFNGPMESLPLAVLEFVRAPGAAMIARGFATAIVLLVLVLILFILARTFAGQDVNRMTDRQLERLTRRSEVTRWRLETGPGRRARAARRRSERIAARLAPESVTTPAPEDLAA